MDLKELTTPPSPLDLALAQQWLRDFQRANPAQGQGLEKWPGELRKYNPCGNNSLEAGREFLDWMRENSLIQPQGQGWVLSMRGVAAILANGEDRKTQDQAWEHVADLISCCRWINSAPVETAPMEIADILLFGSATNPEKDSVGDLDCIILFKSKQEGAYSTAEEHLRKLGMEEVLRPQGSTLPSFRLSLRQWLGHLIPFASLDDQIRTVEVLLDQDEGFGCYSLMGKDWTYGELVKTTADEDADLILRALEQGRDNKRSYLYVSDRLNSIHSSPLNVPEVIKRLLRGREDLSPLKSTWWENLNSPDLGVRRSVIRTQSENNSSFPKIGPAP